MDHEMAADSSDAMDGRRAGKGRPNPGPQYRRASERSRWRAIEKASSTSRSAAGIGITMQHDADDAEGGTNSRPSGSGLAPADSHAPRRTTPVDNGVEWQARAVQDGCRLAAGLGARSGGRARRVALATTTRRGRWVRSAGATATWVGYHHDVRPSSRWRERFSVDHGPARARIWPLTLGSSAPGSSVSPGASSSSPGSMVHQFHA